MAGKSKTGAAAGAAGAAKTAAGVTAIEGDPASKPGKGARARKVAVVAARFNSMVTDKLLAGAVDCLLRHGSKASDIAVVKVPGAVEIPLAAKKLAATRKYAAVIALGCVIRGDTTHYDYVCLMAAQGVAEASMSTGVPVIFGVLTTENLDQAMARAGAGDDNKGWEAALAALEMADLLGKIK